MGDFSHTKTKATFTTRSTINLNSDDEKVSISNELQMQRVTFFTCHSVVVNFTIKEHDDDDDDDDDGSKKL
jgi:hypothetical protein